MRGAGWRVAQDNARRLETVRTLAWQLHGLELEAKRIREYSTAGPEAAGRRLEELRVLISSRGTPDVERELAELGLAPKRVPHPRDVDGPGHLEVVVDLVLLEDQRAQYHRVVVPGEDLPTALVRAGISAVALHGPDIGATRALLQWVGYGARRAGE